MESKKSTTKYVGVANLVAQISHKEVSGIELRDFVDAKTIKTLERKEINSESWERIQSETLRYLTGEIKTERFAVAPGYLLVIKIESKAELSVVIQQDDDVAEIAAAFEYESKKIGKK